MGKETDSLNQTLQHLIREDVNVKLSINPVEEYRLRVNSLKSILINSGRKGFVMSFQSKQASVLSAHIAQTAIKELRAETGDLRYLFLALFLPVGQENLKEAQEVSTLLKNFIGADSVNVCDIKASLAATRAEFPELSDDKGQLVTRVRTAIVQGHAKERNYAVIGTGNASEHVYGEGSLRGELEISDVLPLAGLTRYQVNQMLHFLNAPDFVLANVPSLSESGMSLNAADRYLSGVELDVEISHSIAHRFLTTEHTRRQPTEFITGKDDYLRMQGSRVLAMA